MESLCIGDFLSATAAIRYYGADVRRCYRPYPMLQCCALWGDLDAVKWLLDAGADPLEIAHPCLGCYTVIHCAVLSGRAQILSYLLQRVMFPLDFLKLPIRRYHNGTGLRAQSSAFTLAQMMKHSQMVQLLLERSAESGVLVQGLGTGWSMRRLLFLGRKDPHCIFRLLPLDIIKVLDDMVLNIVAPDAAASKRSGNLFVLKLREHSGQPVPHIAWSDSPPAVPYRPAPLKKQNTLILLTPDALALNSNGAVVEKDVTHNVPPVTDP